MTLVIVFLLSSTDAHHKKNKTSYLPMYLASNSYDPLVTYVLPV
jgi:hypothetical protein